MSRRRILNRCFGVVGRMRRNQFKTGLRILLYHHVGSGLPQDTYGMSVTTEAFRQQMESLATHPNWQTAPLSNGIEGGFTDDATQVLRIAITFDDGYQSLLKNAAPILEEFHIPFTVFVSTAFMESGDPQYLSKSELKELGSCFNACIGAHGHSHHRFTEMSRTRLLRDIQRNRENLEQIMGHPVTTISYPHGSISRKAKSVVKQAGFVLGCGSRFGINKQGCDLLKLSRTEVWNSDTDKTFLEKCSGHWDGYGIYQRLHGL